MITATLFDTSTRPNNIQSNKSKRTFERLLSPAPDFALHVNDSAQRGAVERYIAAQFNQCYNAQIHYYMPLLLTMRCQENYNAVVGIRPGLTKPLFLEHYLAEPIETVLSRAGHTAVDRQHIVEIGNLVATQRGSSQLLFLVLAAILSHCGFKWVVFTATPQVKKTVTRLGIQLHILGNATASALKSTDAENWGSYYENKPQVAAIDVAKSTVYLKQKRLFNCISSQYHNNIMQLAEAVEQERCRYA